jgi:hypothetical protein
MIKRSYIFFIITLISIIACNRDAGNDSPKEVKSPQENLSGQVPKITASIDKNKVNVGDLINLSLRYFIPEDSKFNPDTDLTGLDGLTVTGKNSVNGEIIFTIIIDKTATFDIGQVSLSFKDSKGVLNIIKSDALHIDVLSNLGDKPAEAQLKPIMDIIPTYPFILRLLPWIVGLLVLAAAVAGFYYWKKRKRDKADELRAIKPAYVTAKEEIEKLRSMNLLEKGRYKDFYFRFSEILRQYIERLRGFPAAELTTEEIGRRIKEEIDRILLPVLRESDLVKFADAIPTNAKNDEDVRAALEYIKATVPVEDSPHFHFQREWEKKDELK